MRIVSLFSGGLDSTVLAYLARHDDHDVHLLSFNYGQRHANELEQAKIIARAGGFMHTILDLPALQLVMEGSSQTDDRVDVPEGHYADETMKATVVPNRNMIMLAIGIALAVSEEREAVWYAAHGGDHPIYPDCRPEFVDALDAAAHLANWQPVNVRAPFVRWSKAEIVKLGSEIDAPLAVTWSCYKGGLKHCGRCGTCVERREAFQLAGVDDKTHYDLTEAR